MSGVQFSTTWERAQSCDGEHECGARIGYPDGRVAVRVRVASRRADTKPKPTWLNEADLRH